jgi:hypothetical protein
MNPPAGASMQARVRKLGTLAAALGSQLPGISFFLGLAPPDFRAITLLTSGGTAAYGAVFQYVTVGTPASRG